MSRLLLRSSITLLLHPIYEARILSSSAYRPFTKSARRGDKPLPPRPNLPDSELYHVFLKGSGPGGQKINKTNSAVQMTHLPTGIVVKSQATRSRSQNYKIARQLLAEKIEHMEKGDESRFAKKVERKSEKKRRREKKARRKYRVLEEAKDRELDESGGKVQKLKGRAAEDSKERITDGTEMNK